MKEIRGHHLLCMALYAGHGYDDAFAANMARVIRALRDGEPFRLAAGPDAICACCPNQQPGGGCALGTEDVARRDRAAFRALGLAPGGELGWQGAWEKLRLLTGQGFAAVCGGCRWAREGLCSWALLREKAGENGPLL